MLMGLFYAGGAIGPTLGGLLADRGSVISPFYGATLLHIIYGCLVWFFVPESTTRRAMADSRYRYEEELKNANTERDVNEHLFVRFSKAFWYSVPLGIFMPRPIPGPAGTSSTGKRDWNMTYLAISVGLVNIVVVWPLNLFGECCLTYLVRRARSAASINMHCISLDGRP